MTTTELTIKRLLSTPEGLKRIADNMQNPLRCGGLDYIDGVPYYRYGGRLYTPDQFHKLCSFSTADRSSKSINELVGPTRSVEEVYKGL